MKRIANKSVLCLLLVTILLSTLMADVNYAATQAVITKKNMLNVKVVDED